MFYGTGHYAGIPWATIIAAYQASRTTPHQTVKKTAQRFIDWLPNQLEEKHHLLKKMRNITWSTPPEPADTGVIFTGFGTRQLLPALTYYHIRLVPTTGKVLFPNRGHLVLEEHTTGQIRAFAQDEQVQSFLRGTCQDYQSAIHQALPNLEDLRELIASDTSRTQAENIVSAIEERIATVESDYFNNRLQQIEQTITHLPIGQLATIAESLISLTALWHRINPGTSTVGGPIDVATITKADGLAWLKHKRLSTVEHDGTSQ